MDGQAITVPMARGVRAQFGPRLATNPKLIAPGIPAQLGEEMKVQFVIIHSGWQSAMKEGTLPAYRQGIANLFTKQYNLDLTKLKLTSTANQLSKVASLKVKSGFERTNVGRCKYSLALAPDATRLAQFDPVAEHLRAVGYQKALIT